MKQTTLCKLFVSTSHTDMCTIIMEGYTIKFNGGLFLGSGIMDKFPNLPITISLI
jgi:hypothetical protein